MSLLKGKEEVQGPEETQPQRAGWGSWGGRGLVSLWLDGLGPEGLLHELWKVWLVLLGWIHGVLARDWHHWLLGDHGLLS